MQQPHKSVHRGAWLASLVLVMATLLSACSGNLGQGIADTARLQLNAAINQASAIGVPSSMLADLRRQRAAIDQQRGWFGISDATAAARYLTLVATARTDEQAATSTTQSQASDAIATFAAALQADTAAPPFFTAQLQTEHQQFQQASLPRDYALVLHAAQNDLSALHAMDGAHDALAQFHSDLSGLHGANIATPLADAEYAQLQSAYAKAQTADDFTRLTSSLAAAQVELVNEQTQAIPFAGNSLLTSIQQRISLAKSYGENVSSFQQNVTQLQKTLNATLSLPQYLTFTQQAETQINALGLTMARGQARQNLDQIQTQLLYCTQHNILDYEYTGDVGYANAQNDFANAVTQQDYQAVADETNMLLQNLRAMIANVSDGTPYDQQHQTDLDLMRYYGLTGKVIVVSLREQALRAYDSGTLTLAMLITSGRPELPSPPGLTYISERLSPTVFTSAEPVGSPFYYQPTPVNYALLYHSGGFFIHDAYWRVQFGPGSNLPHYDPQAFNGGSHGCVNVPEQQMAVLYAWTPMGTPVIVY